MEITLDRILVASKAIESIQDIKLPAKTSYRIGRIQDTLSPLVKRFDVIRNELVVKKYGVEIEDKPGQFNVPADKMSEYLTELSSVLSQKENLEGISPINLSDFGDAELPPSFFLDMVDFVVE